MLVAVNSELAGATTRRLRVESRWDPDGEADEFGRVPLLGRRRLVVAATGRGAYGIERSDELVLEGRVFGGAGYAWNLGADDERQDQTPSTTPIGLRAG